MKLTEDIVINERRATARSYAKINLTLDVLGKMDNGYHSIETVMQTVRLSDIVLVDRIERGIKVSTNKKYLPSNNKNISYIAAEAFFEDTKIRGGAKIFIHKNIPVAAGLAGGSGNGAATLAALNMLYNNPLTEEELLTTAARVGADVPYCLMGGTCLGEGIGEILSPLPDMPSCWVLLVTPPINISTPWVYSEMDSAERTVHPDTAAMIKALENGDIYAVSDALSNAMEDVTVKKYPVIGGIKQKMLNNGAIGAVMSGSGATVFGLFDDFIKAKKSQDEFSRMYKDVFLTKTLN